MNPRRPRPAFAVVAASALALAACGGSLFNSKINPPSMYILSAHGAARGPAIAADLVVLKPQVRPGLDTQRIAALYPDSHLDFYAAAEWSGPLDEVIQQFAVASFRERAKLRNVVTDASLVVAGYWLEIEVNDFQAEYTAGHAAPAVHVRLSARLGEAASRRVVGHFEASAVRAAAEDRLSAIVAAYDEAANAAIGEVIAETCKALEAQRAGR